MRTAAQMRQSLAKASPRVNPFFIGMRNPASRQGAGDIIFADAMDPNPGPFEDLATFHNYFIRYSSRLQPDWDPRQVFQKLAGLDDNRPVFFAHADLCMRNIMVSSGEADGGTKATVLAIVDWHQSGWYPAGWKWLKAQDMREPLKTEGRDTTWLKQVLTPPNKEYAYAWEFITTSV